MSSLKPEYHAIAELREFVEQIANGLLRDIGATSIGREIEAEGKVVIS